MPAKPTTIDEYLERVNEPKRGALVELRKTIHSIVPEAEECISYGLAAFRLDGQVIAGFQATTKGCSYYPFSGTTFAILAKELRDYSKTKSALHFTPEKPLPKSLVRKLLRTRIGELEDGERRASGRRRR